MKTGGVGELIERAVWLPFLAQSGRQDESR